jgi:hypothetical protein
MTEAAEVTCVPTQVETEFFERLIQAHAKEAARIGVEVPGVGVYEGDEVTRIVSKTSEGFLVTSFDCKTDEVEHKWFEADPWDDYDGPWPDCDDIGDTPRAASPSRGPAPGPSFGEIEMAKNYPVMSDEVAALYMLTQAIAVAFDMGMMTRDEVDCVVARVAKAAARRGR